MRGLQVATGQASSEEDDDIWGEFDRRASSILTTPVSSTIIEVRQYLEEPNITRQEDPLEWWRSCVGVYPRIA